MKTSTLFRVILIVFSLFFVNPIFSQDSDGDGIKDSIDVDDDNDGILDEVEIISACSGTISYEFYDIAPSGFTVDNIPNSGWTAAGTVEEIDVDKLYQKITPGDGENFSVRYTGDIDIATEDTYTFYLSSDDGSKLYIDGAEIINNDGLHGVKEVSASIKLTQGFHAFEILFFEKGGGEYLGFKYASSTISKQSVPMSILYAENCIDSEGDTDGDGIANRLDLDSDNDGCPDALEGTATSNEIGYSNLDTNFRIVGDVDTEGLPLMANGGQDAGSGIDKFQQSEDCSPCVDVNNPNYVDTDGDLIGDICDLDDDNDGILDVDEIASCSGTISYEFYNIAPNGFTVDNIPNSGWTAVGTAEEINVDKLYQEITPGDGENFSVRYTGDINLVTSDTYTFYLSSDDGSKLYIDGAEIINNDGLHATKETASSVYLTQGFHAFEILFFEKTGGENLDFKYASSSISKQSVPMSILYAKNCMDLDTDEDGINNRLDLDSDNDGCPDAMEGNTTSTVIGYSHLDASYRIKGGVDANGIPNIVNGGQGVGTSVDASQQAEGCGCGDIDTDGDSIGNICDVDDDNDGILDVDECLNLLVNSGFNNKTGLNYGNNINVDISPWVLGQGDQSNIVKVDGNGGFDYANGGPFEDANPETGDGEDQYYLDIASGSNDFYQSFTVTENTQLTYGGYFSSRDGLTGSGRLRIFTGDTGSSGTLIIDSGIFNVSPSDGDSSNTPWKYIEDEVNVTAGTYSFVVSMDNHMNFDEGFAIACYDTDGDGYEDKVDIDSDNDGIPDNVEAQTTLGYMLPNGTVNTSGNYPGLWSNYGTGLKVIDTDDDDTPDFLDINSDNDAYNDIQENGLANSILSEDDDKDGLDNAFETNGTNDATLDVNEDIEAPTDLSILPDSDGNLNSGGDLDYRDVLIIDYPSSASIDFDGVDDYLSGNALLNGLDNLTIMAWIKIDAENTKVANITIAGEDIGCRLYVKNGNELMFGVKTSANISMDISGGIINYNEWHHVTGVFSGATGKQTIYVDGEMKATETNNAQIGATIASSSDWTGDFEVGRISSNISNKQYFNGEIDEVRAFNTVLTDSQIQTMIYQEIQNNSGNVKGVIVPKDIIDFETKATVPWSSLIAYYPMTDITSNKITDYSQNDNELLMHNITSVQDQTAPMPYKTSEDGSWNSQEAWQHGNVWDVESIENIRAWSIVKINNDVTVSNSISTYGLIIENGKTITVNGSNAVENTGYLELSGTIDLMDDSQLIQTQTSDLVTSNEGKVLRRQEGTPSAYWYNYWSSPTGEKGASILIDNNAQTNNPNNSDFRLDMLKDDAGFNTQFTNNYTGNGEISTYWLYTFINGLSYWDWVQITPSTQLNPGIGYTQKGTGVPTDKQQYIFEGKPNNGTILVPVQDKGGAGSVPGKSKTQFLLGNPYASAIDVVKFIDDNESVIDGTLQLWQQWSGTSHNLADYNGGYAQVNKLGGVRARQFSGLNGGTTGEAVGTLVPTRYLPVGQGFITEIIANGNVEFNNGQRVFIKEADADGKFKNGSVFSKQTTSKSAIKEVEDENELIKKIRLEFNTIVGPKSKRELLLGFSKITSDDFDYGYEAETDDISNNDLNLSLEGKNMNMQAYSEITAEKVVPLNFRSSGDNTFEIRISDVEDVDDAQEIYLKDNLTGVYFDLRTEQSYSFTSQQGVFNKRFEIVFQSESATLSSQEIKVTENYIYYDIKSNVLYVKKLNSEVTKFTLYNISGQSMMELNTIDMETLSSGLRLPNMATGTYIACFRTDTNQVITKKFIKN
ncbi:PA14 domain-containing protein [Hyunsoonleella pacifica]|uniref:T9SS type A sorting domain-containing protein n=1 Tax=Hyunsoonleella pacifica TaxID=1080224 RepID=A0A4Q9FNX8_9FLAO|nr:PA14 domain-containing protein [Hyunsoonleella pacifica]TBN16389.1 T9SS type A sorting domain-containing protein [Hyunsoonleella pacifica]GGD19825.1 hypothetical protein GCM10011368_22190 [Hyunsoonleella pacifica]